MTDWVELIYEWYFINYSFYIEHNLLIVMIDILPFDRKSISYQKILLSVNTRTYKCIIIIKLFSLKCILQNPFTLNSLGFQRPDSYTILIILINTKYGYYVVQDIKLTMTNGLFLSKDRKHNVCIFMVASFALMQSITW